MFTLSPTELPGRSSQPSPAATALMLQAPERYKDDWKSHERTTGPLLRHRDGVSTSVFA